MGDSNNAKLCSHKEEESEKGNGITEQKLTS